MTVCFFLPRSLINFADVDDLLGIESDRRLVKNQHFGIAYQSLCQSYTLFVTFGKVLDDSVVDIGDFNDAADFINVDVCAGF